MPKLLLSVAGLAVLIVLLWGVYHKGYNSGFSDAELICIEEKDTVKKQAEDDLKQKQKAIDALDVQTAKLSGRLQEKQKVVKQQVIKYVEKNSGNAVNCLGNDGVQLINSAIRAGDPASSKARDP